MRTADFVVALRDAHLASRTCVRARAVEEWGNHPVVALLVEGRDHRIVAWAPGSDGLVVNRRALQPGTAVKAAT
jgi:hypothetical protein